jgi:hypothetical protein
MQNFENALSACMPPEPLRLPPRIKRGEGPYRPPGGESARTVSSGGTATSPAAGPGSLSGHPDPSLPPGGMGSQSHAVPATHADRHPPAGTAATPTGRRSGIRCRHHAGHRAGHDDPRHHTALRDGDHHDLDQLLRTVTAEHGSHPDDLAALVTAGAGVTGGGQLGATRASRRRDNRTGSELSWLDCPNGRLRISTEPPGTNHADPTHPSQNPDLWHM